MSTQRPYIPAGYTKQGRYRSTACPDAEPVQLAPAECGTDIGADDDGTPLTITETVKFWLSMSLPAISLGALALMLWATSP